MPGFVRTLWIIFLVSLACRLHAQVPESERVRLTVLPSSGEILQAEFRSVGVASGVPRAVLILCPGQNGNGAEYLSNREWRAFAEENKLAIVVPGFVSHDEDLVQNRGYFVADRGSGGLLEEALRLHGWEALPRLLYGFSGGAHFVMSFSSMAPAHVLGFCSYSFGWWQASSPELRCPAIIACGQFDGTRYGSSFSYFQNGRSHGKPWAWVSLKGQQHEPSDDLDSFVRSFFKALLTGKTGEPVTLDNVRKLQVTDVDRLATSIVPSADLVQEWQALHHP